MKYCSLFIFLFLISNCTTDNGVKDVQRDSWELIYKNDKDGNGLYGSKNDLLSAVRNGRPVRVYFGNYREGQSERSIEHQGALQFLSIANGKEVFGQITPIIGQYPNLDADTLSITFRENLKWTIMVGSNGMSDRLMMDSFQDTVVGHQSRRMSLSWFTQY